MTLQDLGSLAEVVGAIATVAALIYLAVQVRANTTSMLAESRRATLDATTATIIAIAENEQLARIFNDGLVAFSKLEGTDRTRFAMIFGSLLFPLAVAVDQARIGVRHDSFPQAGGVASFLRTPGGREWWVAFQDRYSDAFRRYVDTEILLDKQSAA